MDSKQMGLIQTVSEMALTGLDDVLPGVLGLGEAIHMDLWQYITLIQVLLFVTEQSVEDINKGDCQGR